MKRFFYALLACALLLMAAGCGGNGQTKNSGAESGGSQPDAEPAGVAEPEDETPAPEPEKELTLDDGEVRLVYVGDGVLAAIFHGPYKDIGMSFCYKDGSKLEEELFLGYGDLNPGWTMGVTYEYTGQYALEELGLHVSDYAAPRNPDNTYAAKAYPIGPQMSDSELEAAGFDFLDGRCCIVGTGRCTYGSNNFGLLWGLTWFCDSYDREAETVDIEGFRDKVAFYYGDGTPLEDFAEGYTLEINWQNDASLTALFYQDSGGSNGEDEHNQMCDELKAAQPYMVYTNDDGTTQEFPLLRD